MWALSRCPIQPSHRPIIAPSFSAWASTRGIISTVVSTLLYPYAHPASPSAASIHQDTSLEPTVVTFRLSPSYGIHTARAAHDWFLSLMREHEGFVVEIDVAGEPPLAFWSETVRRVVVE